jgi:iron complex outermembrane recepter protein
MKTIFKRILMGCAFVFTLLYPSISIAQVFGKARANRVLEKNHRDSSIPKLQVDTCVIEELRSTALPHHPLDVDTAAMIRFAEMHITHHSPGNHSDHLHFKELYLSSTLSISEKMAELPMIRLLKTGNSIQKPTLQGLSGLRLPLFQDGIRIQGQGWGNDHAPELGRWGVQDIVVRRGAEALQYAADGWGNYLEIRYRPPFHAHENHLEVLSAYQSNAQAGQIGARYTQGGHQEHEGFYVSLQHQDAGDYRIPGASLPNTAYRESSMYGGYSLPTKKSIHKLDASYFQFKGGIYLGSHIGNLTDLKTAIASNVPLITSQNTQRGFLKPYQEAENMRISWERVPLKEEGFYWKMAYQKNQRKEFDPHRNSSLQFPQLNVWLHNYQYYASKKSYIFGKTLQLGGQYEYKSQDWGGFFLTPAFRGHELGLFGHFPWKSGQWHQQLTLRFDALTRNTELKEQPLDESFHGFSAAYSAILIKGSTKNEIHVSIGQRAPSVNERFSSGVHHGSASFEQGNPQIGLEKGIKIDWERQSRRGKLNYRSNLYSLYASNFIHLNPQPTPILSIRGAFPYYIYEGLPTWYVGANLWANYSFSHSRMEASADLLWGKILRSNRFPTQMPPPSMRLEWHQDFKKATGIFRQTWVSQMPFYTENTDLAPPPKPYGVSDVFVRIPSLFSKWNIKIELGIHNLFDITYRDYLDRFRYFTPQMGRNVFLQCIWNIHQHRIHQTSNPNPKPQTPNFKPQTSNPKLQTPNSKLQTPNFKPQTSNPKPQTLNPKLN